MTYREPSERAEPDDGEAIAITELGRRAQRTRQLIIVPLILIGIAVALVVYGLLRDWQFEMRGAHSPWLTAAMAFTPCFGGSLLLAPRLANLVVARMLPRWRRSLARAYGLDEAELEETTRLL